MHAHVVIFIVILLLLDYGLNVDNPGQAPKGPTFLLEPQDTIVIGSKASSVYLDCLAQSNPPSTYEWWMISNDNIKKTLPQDIRYVLYSPQKSFMTIFLQKLYLLIINLYKFIAEVVIFTRV